MTSDELKAIRDLKAHAKALSASGIMSFIGPYYPMNLAGEHAEKYRAWSKAAYSLIQRLPQ